MTKTLFERIADNTQHPVFIAELSGNHNGDIQRAHNSIDAAARSGADVFKLQTYTPDTLTIRAEGGLFSIRDRNSLWDGRTLYDLYEQAHTPWEWHEELFAHIRECGMIPMSTPFDPTAVEFLEQFDLPAYKIASFENNYVELLEAAAATGRTIVMSTGLSELIDIDESVDVLQTSGCTELVLMKCTSSYPADPRESNLKSIATLQQKFDIPVGLSDHTLGMGVPIAAVAVGARCIEKHFVLDRGSNDVDEAFSLTPQEFSAMRAEAIRAWQALGTSEVTVQPGETSSLRFKRSIYVVEDIKAGEAFTTQNTRVIRPGDGLHPRNYQDILRARADVNLSAGTPLCAQHVKNS